MGRTRASKNSGLNAAAAVCWTSARTLTTVTSTAAAKNTTRIQPIMDAHANIGQTGGDHQSHSGRNGPRARQRTERDIGPESDTDAGTAPDQTCVDEPQARCGDRRRRKLAYHGDV